MTLKEQAYLEKEDKHEELYRITAFDHEKHTAEDFYFNDPNEAIIKGVREIDKGKDVFFLELIWGEVYDVSAHLNVIADKIK